MVVTEPRMPCYKLGLKFGRSDIPSISSIWCSSWKNSHFPYGFVHLPISSNYGTAHADSLCS